MIVVLFMIYFYCISFLIVFLVLHFLRKRLALVPYNQKPLHIATFDGHDSPYHPSVLFFEKGWKGWRYWMAETPFSPKSQPYRDRYECPCIHVSNDGIHWQVPEGMRNPLVDLNERQVNDWDFYSDPQLLFVDDHLELYFRITERHGHPENFSDMTLCKITSTNGTEWSEMKRWNHPGFGLVSPGMTYDAQKGYRMWCVTPEAQGIQRHVAFVIPSCKGVDWQKAEVCTLKGPAVNPWHIDVQEMDGGLFLTIYDYHEITLWRGNADRPTEFEFMQTVIQPAKRVYGSFYSNGLYRACLVKTDKGVEMFFSADDLHRTYLGRMVCKDIQHNAPFQFAGPEGRHAGIAAVISQDIFYNRRRFIFIIKQLTRKFL